MRRHAEANLRVLGRAVSFRVLEPRWRRPLLRLLALRHLILLARGESGVLDGLAADDSRRAT